VGILDWLKRESAPSEGLVFSAVVEEGPYTAMDGETLWRSGLALVHDTGQFMRWDSPELLEVGAFICRVAGVSFRPDALQREEFSPCNPLVLRPEPENPHDPNAVGVWDASGQIQVGYLPRDRAGAVSGAFRTGRPMGAMVLQELRTSERGKRVSLVILVCPVGSIELQVQR